MIGTELAHFRITAKLGQGGMGKVYLAEDSKLKRRVALKMLPEEMSSNREALERFQREAEAVAALNHPNIVHIYSIESAGDLNFLTMELVEGETLGELTPSGGLTLDRFFEVALAGLARCGGVLGALGQPERAARLLAAGDAQLVPSVRANSPPIKLKSTR